MGWKDMICRPLVVTAFCIIAGILILWKLEWKTLIDEAGDRQSNELSSGTYRWKKSNRQFGEDEPYIEDIPARDGLWQNVDGWNYVYSAYLDERARWPHTIRIIGVTRTYEREIFQCKVWYSNGTSVEGKAKMQKFRRGYNKFKYTACFILCPLKTEEIPESVSVITHKHRLTNRLLVINTKQYDKTINRQQVTNQSKTKQTPEEIGICVKPLEDNYNNSLELVEFMELNWILGMKQVTFYKSSISHTTECILRNYVDDMRATLAIAVPWKNDLEKSHTEIKNENELVALNDCLYRNMHNFSYLAFLDIDQFIIPALNYTVQELIGTLETKYKDVPHEIGSYSIQNGFFYLEWPDDVINEKSQDVYARSLTTLRKTLRKLHLHPHGNRSKYIVKPKTVIEVGDESVSQFVQGFGSCPAFEDEAVLNHYRLCEYGGSTCTKEKSRADRNVFRYKDQLAKAVKLRWQKLQKICGLEDVQQARFDAKRPETSSRNFKPPTL